MKYKVIITVSRETFDDIKIGGLNEKFDVETPDNMTFEQAENKILYIVDDLLEIYLEDELGCNAPAL